jgi:hypothetical protein
MLWTMQDTEGTKLHICVSWSYELTFFPTLPNLCAEYTGSRVFERYLPPTPITWKSTYTGFAGHIEVVIKIFLMEYNAAQSVESPHGNSWQQAIAKICAKRSAWQIPILIVLFVILVVKI